MQLQKGNVEPGEGVPIRPCGLCRELWILFPVGLMLRVSNGGASRYELLFQSTFLTGFAQVTGDQGQKEILLAELEC